MHLLDFQKEIIRETIPQSNILITANGLDTLSIIIAQLIIYDIKNGITLLLNASDIQKEIFAAQDFEHWHNKEINKAEKRKDYYLFGGIFPCSQQTLLSDLINGVLDTTKISCIFVLNIENLRMNDHVAFIIDFVRRENENCNIRGFTEDIGINLEETRLILQVNKVHFYPRFHESVQRDLQNDLDFMTRNLAMSKGMEEAQILLIETIKLLVAELKKEDKNGIQIDYDNMLNEVDNICKEASLLAEKYFYKSSVRRYVNDIKTIKFLLGILFFDYQVFSSTFEIFWDEQVKLKDKSTWINLESAIVIMEKLGINRNDAKKVKYDDEQIDNMTSVKESIKDMHFTEGKIKALDELLNKLENAIILVRSSFAKEALEIIYEKSKGKILIFTHKEYQHISEIREYIILFEYNLESIRKIEIIHSRHKESGTVDIKKVKVKNKAKIVTDYSLQDNEKQDEVTLTTSNDDYYSFSEFKGIYILNYKNSVEEQGYLIKMRSECELFKSKINQYSRLPLITFDTSIILDETDKTEYDIQIDFREMRCKLPYYLYRSGAKISVVALEVGDYIIGNVVIERKSIGDFINSINTGRLYTQTRNMVHYYKNIYLLLEFVGRTCISDYVDNYIYQKLAIYLICFPMVKIIWSDNELTSVKLIRQIQQNHSNNYHEKGIDPIILEILLNLPGIDTYNLKRVTDNFEDLRELIESDKERICKALGKSAGSSLFDFFNKNINEK